MYFSIKQSFHLIKIYGVSFLKSYTIFTKKTLLVMACILICIGFICCEIYAVSNMQTNAITNADRLTFIKSLGYTVSNSEPRSKTVVIPQVFSDVYTNYNNLQKSCGYDLSLYKGCEVLIYTYDIIAPDDSNDGCVVNIIVYNDRIIGGDVSSVTFGGFMLPLKVGKSEKAKTG